MDAASRRANAIAVGLIAALLGAPGAVCGPHAIASVSNREMSLEAAGSVRLTGAFLHFPVLPPPLPQADDGLALGVARLLLEGDLSAKLDYDVNLFLDLTRAPAFVLGGAFATAGSFESPYRTKLLRWDFWEDGSIRGRVGVDRVILRFHRERVQLTVGRFPVNHSVTSIFAPNDVFAPFAASSVNRIYKPGVDALQLGIMLGPLSSLEAVGVLGSADNGDPTWSRSALVARASTVLVGFHWAALAGKLAERWVGGGSIQGEAGPVGLRGEGHVAVQDVDGDGVRDGRTAVRVAQGAEVRLPWRNVLVGAEYRFASDGGSDASQYAERALRFFLDDQIYLGQHYLGCYAGGEIIPILRASALALVNAQDPSGLVSLALTYDVADEAAFLGGVLVPWGARPKVDASGLAALESEYGLFPTSVFLETRVYF